ncbi:hypothetical protein MF672_024365 [Actinomadura sp. ATCC 31491]|uniref:Uncharacterized protein n=1 Tax=Actinomadura luzonensis TaxID=2805427 RepID=A0ABT0FX42_9ACTN|nr:hypothetical protein [Actinomadura luzonensis]MCK2216902.1 hypothetical protein [Actinomadura luzonensis]
MKGNLIAAGGVLAAAVAIVGLAGPANAHTVCDLSVNDNTGALGIDTNGVYAGRREARACKDSDDWHDHGDWGKDDEDWYKEIGWGRDHQGHGHGWGDSGNGWGESGNGWHNWGGGGQRYPGPWLGRS